MEVFIQLFGEGGACYAEGSKHVVEGPLLMSYGLTYLSLPWSVHSVEADKSSEIALDCSAQDDRNKGSETAPRCLLIGNRLLGNLMLPLLLSTCSLIQSNATLRIPGPHTCGNELVPWAPTLLA